MTREDLDYIGAMNLHDEISNEAYKKIACHFEGQEPKTDNRVKIELNRVKNELEPCEDAISRQAVLDLVEHYNSDGLGSVFYGYEEGVKFANAVNKLPSVKPQEKTGHWIDIDSETYTWKIRCDQCGHERSMMSTQGKYPNFCEECGTDMRGGA